MIYANYCFIWFSDNSYLPLSVRIIIFHNTLLFDVSYKIVGLVCQGNIDLNMKGALPMFAIWREYCLLLIEMKHTCQNC